jgi:hypothetical protein
VTTVHCEEIGKEKVASVTADEVIILHILLDTYAVTCQPA